jgi:hypothetical protein
MIILQCVTQKKKLRIRFHCYIDDEGKTYMNVYNNDYNCQFPKDIRQDGLFYEIKDDDMSLISDGSKKPFYKVNKNNIRILTIDEIKKYSNTENNTAKVDISTLKLYEVAECVVCLSEPSSVIFIPCAHMAMCKECYVCMKDVKQKSYCTLSSCPSCPLCRKIITNVIDKNVDI